MNMAPHQVCAFLTHIFDCSIERRYQKLKADLNGRVESCIFAQVGTPVSDNLLDEVCFFGHDVLNSRERRVVGDSISPGNLHLVALDFYRNHPGFEFYWFIEYDVIFTGNWTVLFDAVGEDSADLLAAHIRSRREEPDWSWWETLSLPGSSLEPSDWLRGFFPIYRISRRGLQVLDDHVKMGWSGHFEGLIPCIMRSASLSISDLGGTSLWTPKQRRHQFYSSFSSVAGFLNAGTHRYRPAHYLPRLRRNTIFHPIKKSIDFREVFRVFLSMRHNWRRYSVHCVESFYYTLLSFWPFARRIIR
jgi:hypothetical protein